MRNALARFEQVGFEDDGARERARQKLLRAAKKHGIVPLGFFDGQLRKERQQGEIRARATDVASLPRGLVTFVLTDIEGSTKLLERLGDAYAGVLRDVRTMIRSAVRRSEGHEVDARADEFFAVFEDPIRALEGAVAIQRALAKHRWPNAAAVKVRIGVHTGRPTLTDTGYIGIAVHTAARVCSAGHGGQILLSSAAKEAVGVPRVTGVAVKRLGRFALRGLADPVPLFQVYANDLPAKFPEPRELAPASS